MNITLKVFKAKYLADLHSILDSQDYEGIAHIEMKTLPKLGYIAYLGKTPIAAGFLRRLEPSFAQIDTLCSNSHFGSQIRHLGITAIVDALITDAKRLKLQGIVAHTTDKGILERAKSLGFHIVPQTIIALPLKP